MDDGDRLSLHELPCRYGDIIDDGRWETLRTIFFDDATFEVNGRLLNGLGEIRHYMQFEARHPRCHLITNVYVTETADGATLSSRVLTVRPEGVNNGRYIDQVVKGADGWRVASRVFNTLVTVPFTS
jgi:hypothetical protein